MRRIFVILVLGTKFDLGITRATWNINQVDESGTLAADYMPKVLNILEKYLEPTICIFIVSRTVVFKSVPIDRV